MLDDEGNEWARFQLDKRKPTSIEHIPQHAINAFIAAEDWNFFKHHGISIKGILRSILVNLYYGGKVQGASTITQQLVKLLFFEQKKTFSRKVKEQLYALLVELQFSKGQILQTYLNHIYFGCGIYGVEAASQRFWQKSAKDLTLRQAATLAGIVRSPGNYCPLIYPLSAQKRRNTVLRKMRRLKFITQEEYELAAGDVVRTKEAREPMRLAPHVKEQIRQFLEKIVGKKALYSDGLTIKTTLNTTIQQQAERAFKEHCEQLQKTIPGVDGALISIDVKTGGIRALVGGYDFATSKFNRALQAKRQLGSVFKPLVYAVAVEQGAKFSDTQVDEPLEIMQGTTIWSPNNFDMKFRGQMSLAYALSHSNNIVAIKTFLNTGIMPVIELAKKCRLQGQLNPYPSLALGCIESTLQEAVGMFNIFANHGVYVKPHLISWVKDQWGTKIYKHEHEQERVMSSKVSGQVAKVMELGLKRVRKRFKIWPNAQVISKTGTTNDSRTCWFTGSTPTLTTAIYIGRDDNGSMGGNVYPIKTALPIWLALNGSIEHAQKEFVFDPLLKEVLIHAKSGRQIYDLPPSAGAVAILI